MPSAACAARRGFCFQVEVALPVGTSVSCQALQPEEPVGQTFLSAVTTSSPASSTFHCNAIRHNSKDHRLIDLDVIARRLFNSAAAACGSSVSSTAAVTAT